MSVTGEVPITLLLCSTCTGTGTHDVNKAAIANALERQGLSGHVQVRDVACMGACEKPVSVGLQGAGRASYVFAGVEPQGDADDIAQTCRTYLDSPEGWIDDARPCGRLRLCLRARLPALPD